MPKISTAKCMALTRKGLPCSNSIKAGTHCTQHSDQDPTSRPVLRCGAPKADGSRCSRVTPYGTFEKPGHCHVHRLSPQDLNFITCFGKEIGGQRCKKSVAWKAPYFQFCPTHADQAPNFGCPIETLPVDVTSMILDKLDPHERVAFALAGKGCANLVRSWGSTRSVSAIPAPGPRDFIFTQPSKSSRQGPVRSILYRFQNLERQPLSELLQTQKIAHYIKDPQALKKVHTPSCTAKEFAQFVEFSSNTLDMSLTTLTSLNGLRSRVATAYKEISFKLPDNKGRCLICGEVDPYIPESPKELRHVCICQSCYSGDLHARWCEHCCGPISLLAFARALHGSKRSYALVTRRRQH